MTGRRQGIFEERIWGLVVMGAVTSLSWLLTAAVTALDVLWWHKGVWVAFAAVSLFLACVAIPVLAMEARAAKPETAPEQEI